MHSLFAQAAGIAHGLCRRRRSSAQGQRTRSAEKAEATERTLFSLFAPVQSTFCHTLKYRSYLLTVPKSHQFRHMSRYSDSMAAANEAVSQADELLKRSRIELRSSLSSRGGGGIIGPANRQLDVAVQVVGHPVAQPPSRRIVALVREAHVAAQTPRPAHPARWLRSSWCRRCRETCRARCRSVA